MAPRKRKVQVTENAKSPEKVKHCTACIQIVLNAQHNESLHSKCLKELKTLYEKTDHKSFMLSFIHVIKSAMQKDEDDPFGNNMMKFCAYFVASYDDEETHPVIKETFDWLLNTISQNPLIRFKICQFVNYILNSLGVEAAIDDMICDKILKYMLERMRDISPNVRVQAVLALQRLQNPENPNDLVFRAYSYHLECDPSPKVRMSIITSIGRNTMNTMPCILDRLWDVDEKVRRHTYIQMSSYPVRAYKVAHRLTFLEQGLSDHSDGVCKVVRNILLPQWIESYNKDYVAFVTALKLDAVDSELEKFRGIAKNALFQIFKKQTMTEVIESLQLNDDRFISVDRLSDEHGLERAIVWQAVFEHLQNEDSDDFDLVSVELSGFSTYIKQFADNYDPGAEPYLKIHFQFILLTLLEMVASLDFADEFGKENLKKVLNELMSSKSLDKRNVEIVVKIFDSLIPDKEARFKNFIDIIKQIVQPTRFDMAQLRELLDTYFAKNPDSNLKMRVTSLRYKIMELREQETHLVDIKDYSGAKIISDEIDQRNEEYANLLRPILLETETVSENNLDETHVLLRELLSGPQKVSTENVTKCLQISFYMVNSKSINSLTPAVCELYKDFIGRHVESNDISVRDWALQCGAAYSMLYDGLAKEVFQKMYQQFFRNHTTRIWKTSIDSIFELLDRYGFEYFDLDDKTNDINSSVGRKSSRQLYNNSGYTDREDENDGQSGNGVDVMQLMVHFLETCDDQIITTAIIDGFCRIILHGHYTSQDIVSKLLLKYFNPVTEPKTNQILGIFFESLIKKKKQEYLQKPLINTLFIILEAPSDSPLQEIKPEIVLKFVIDSTRPQYCSPGLNLHSTIAMSFLQVMLDNLEYKNILKILSKELLTLEITDDPVLKHDLIQCAETLINNETIDPKIIKTIKSFKEILEGSYKDGQVPVNSTQQDSHHHSEHEDEGGIVEEHEHENVPQETELYPNERLILNRSSVLGTPPHSSTINQQPEIRSGIRSLRRSLNVSRPPRDAPSTFKIPQEDATRALRKKAAAANLQIALASQSSQEEEEENWSVNATQEITTPNASLDESIEVPATQHFELPMTQTEQIADNTSSSDEEEEDKDETLKEKENSQESDDEVVPASPNATRTRRPIGIARLRNITTNRPHSTSELSPKPRTRNATKEVLINSKVMTRKSLTELNSGKSSKAVSAVSKKLDDTHITRRSKSNVNKPTENVANEDKDEDIQSEVSSTASSSSASSGTPRRKRIIVDAATINSPSANTRSMQLVLTPIRTRKSKNFEGNLSPLTPTPSRPSRRKVPTRK